MARSETGVITVDAAARLGLSAADVLRLVDDGALDAYRSADDGSLRIRVRSLEAFERAGTS